MPDTKITALTAISTVDPAVDVLPIVDVSDTTMAASGTTKKITSNQILGAGGTATLASATITGDLNVSGNGAFTGTGYAALQRALIPVGENGATSLDFRWYSTGTTYTTGARVYASSDAAWTASSTPARLMFSTVPSGSTSLSERYRIDNAGIHTWQNVGGVAGTAMTLNSTGLGVGASPNFKLDVAGAANSAPITLLRLNNIGTTGGGPGIAARLQFNAGATALGFIQGCNFASGSIGVQISGDGTNIHQTIDSSGNVGIGVTPSAWNSNYNALDIGQNGTISGRVGTSNTVDIVSNGFRNSAGNWVYKLATSNTACRYQLDGSTGSHIWYSGVAGTAGNTIAGFSAGTMTLDASGRLITNSSTFTPPTLNTNGELNFIATSNTNVRFSYRGTDGVTRVANITLA